MTKILKLLFFNTCRRGEANCKYFHPPKHLSLQVINMGRNNKRMKSEMMAKIKMQYQQQQVTILLPHGMCYSLKGVLFRANLSI